MQGLQDCLPKDMHKEITEQFLYLKEILEEGFTKNDLALDTTADDAGAITNDVWKAYCIAQRNELLDVLIRLIELPIRDGLLRQSVSFLLDYAQVIPEETLGQFISVLERKPEILTQIQKKIVFLIFGECFMRISWKNDKALERAEQKVLDVSLHSEKTKESLGTIAAYRGLSRVASQKDGFWKKWHVVEKTT